MTSRVFHVQAKKWSRRTPNNLFFDYTSNMLVIEKNLDHSQTRQKKVASHATPTQRGVFLYSD